MATTRKGPGRPVSYELTGAQKTRIRNLFNSGYTFKEIQERVGVHEYAVLRVRREMRAEGL